MWLMHDFAFLKPASDLAGDGQECDASPVATFVQIPSRWMFDDCSKNRVSRHCP